MGTKKGPDWASMYTAVARSGALLSMLQDLAPGGTLKDNEYTCKCPAPGHNDTEASFGCNVTTGKYKCFGCSLKGYSLYKLYKLLAGDNEIKYGEFFKLVQRRYNGPDMKAYAQYGFGAKNKPETSSGPQKGESEQKPQVFDDPGTTDEPKVLPKGIRYHYLEKGTPIHKNEYATQYWTSRKADPKFMSELGCRYLPPDQSKAKDADSKLYVDTHRTAFPLYHDNQLVQSRLYRMGQAIPKPPDNVDYDWSKHKFRHVKGHPINFMTYWGSTYGRQRLPIKCPAYLVEGEPDAATLISQMRTAKTKGVVMFHSKGVGNFNPQLANDVAKQCKERQWKLHIICDYDTAGIDGQKTTSRMILHAGCEHKLVKWRPINLPPNQKKDLTDWFIAGGSVPKLEQLRWEHQAAPFQVLDAPLGRIYEEHGKYWAESQKEDRQLTNFTVKVLGVDLVQSDIGIDRVYDLEIKTPYDGKKSLALRAYDQRTINTARERFAVVNCRLDAKDPRELAALLIEKAHYDQAPHATVPVRAGKYADDNTRGLLFGNAYIEHGSGTVYPANEGGIIQAPGNTALKCPDIGDREWPVIDTTSTPKERLEGTRTCLKVYKEYLGDQTAILLGAIALGLLPGPNHQRIKVPLVNLFGAPGAGKSSLADSIIAGLGDAYRRLFRISLTDGMITEAAMIKMLGYSDGLWVHLDELRMGKSYGQKQRTNYLQGTFRNAYDKAGRIKLGGYNYQTTQVDMIKSNLVVSGEEVPDDAATSSRFVGVDIPPLGKHSDVFYKLYTQDDGKAPQQMMRYIIDQAVKKGASKRIIDMVKELEIHLETDETLQAMAETSDYRAKRHHLTCLAAFFELVDADEGNEIFDQESCIQTAVDMFANTQAEIQEGSSLAQYLEKLHSAYESSLHDPNYKGPALNGHAVKVLEPRGNEVEYRLAFVPKHAIRAVKAVARDDGGFDWQAKTIRKLMKNQPWAKLDKFVRYKYESNSIRSVVIRPSTMPQHLLEAAGLENLGEGGTVWEWKSTDVGAVNGPE